MAALAKAGWNVPSASSSPTTARRPAGYRRAAAVLAFFDPAQLKPVGAVGPRGAFADLAGDIVSYYDAGDFTRWTLRPEVRRATLRHMPRSLIEEALGANPLPSHPLQSMLTSYLRDQVPSIAEMSVEELEAAVQVARWVSAILPGRPGPDEIRVRLDRERLLEEFRPLVAHFSGRTSELDTLRDFVEVLDPSSRREAVLRQVDAWRGGSRRMPMALHGPGGVGKSTLMAKFMLDHGQLDTASQIPYVYLDFDKPALIVDEPGTLLLEAIRQLKVQYPQPRVAAICADLETQCLAAIEERTSDDDRIDWSRSSETWIAEQRTIAESQLARRAALVTGFVDLIRAAIRIAEQARAAAARTVPAPNVDRPFLLVLDTFEEAEYRTTGALRRLWWLLEALQASYPRTRIVLSGRVPPEGPDVPKLNKVEVKALDQAAAEALLISLGVTDPAVARKVARQVERNPLSLHLAAEVLRSETATQDGIAGLQTTSFLWIRRNERLIQGELYVRILSHIHDEAVRKLAHPGMVVRRVDAGVIQEVLAGPCEVAVPDRATADDLLERMRREITLVVRQADGSLKHRQDVRSRMLELLQKDKPAQVRQINENAVVYYSGAAAIGMDPIEARAEEIYHRLLLDQDSPAIDERWLPGVDRYLRGIKDDLPRRAWAYLAARTGITSSQSIIREAGDQLSWELFAATEAEDLLRDNLPDRALAVLRERSDRSSGSRLYAIEAKVLNRLGRRAEAMAVIDVGITDASKEGATAALAELYPIGAEQAEGRGDLATADLYLRRAEEILRRSGDERALSDVLARRLRIVRMLPQADPELTRSLEAEVAGRFLQSDAAALAADPVTVKQLVRLVGAERSDVLARSLSLLDVHVTDPSKLDPLAESLAANPAPAGAVLTGYRWLTGTPDTEPWTEESIRNLLQAAASSGVLRDLLLQLVAAIDPDAASRVQGASATPAPPPPSTAPAELSLSSEADAGAAVDDSQAMRGVIADLIDDRPVEA